MFRRKKIDVEVTKATLEKLGVSEVDPDILACAIDFASHLGRSPQQAALGAAQLQQLRRSGKRVIITDDGWHTA